MSRRALTFVVSAVAVVGLLVAGFLLPVPYVILQPGITRDTLGSVSGSSAPLIKISGHRQYATNGHLILLTVYVVGGPGMQPSLFDAVGSWFDNSQAVLPQELIYPPGQSVSQVQQSDTLQMLDSQQAAITAALHELNIPVHTVITVGSIDPKSGARGVLKPGDAVLAVDGTAVTSMTQLRSLIGAKPAGSALVLRIRRAGRVQTLTVHSMAGPGGTIIGFVPQETAVYPFSISIGLKDVGGPSAGMMFALGIVDKLSPGDLTGGRAIAGTGTIDSSGTVGPIGGIQQKVFAALNAGATVFLAPSSECGSAKAVAPARLRVVPVASLSGAIAALHDLDGGQPVPSC